MNKKLYFVLCSLLAGFSYPAHAAMLPPVSADIDSVHALLATGLLITVVGWITHQKNK